MCFGCPLRNNIWLALNVARLLLMIPTALLGLRIRGSGFDDLPRDSKTP